MDWNADAVIYAIDLVGTASFAFSGALRAIDRRPDFVGMLILAGATAAGGSATRDLLLGRPVMILRDWGYPLAILLSAAATFFFPASVTRGEKLFRYSDAVGLGVFSAFTASLAWQTPGINPLSVLFIATVSGCAGGVIRDLIIRKETLVLTNELYVTPMIVGAAALMAVQALGAGGMAGFLTAMAVTTGLRLLAIRFEWRLPRLAVHRPPEDAPAPDAPRRDA